VWDKKELGLAKDCMAVQKNAGLYTSVLKFQCTFEGNSGLRVVLRKLIKARMKPASVYAESKKLILKRAAGGIVSAKKTWLTVYRAYPVGLESENGLYKLTFISFPDDSPRRRGDFVKFRF
jgi:hypothetical protein